MSGRLCPRSSRHDAVQLSTTPALDITMRAIHNTADWPWVKGQHCVRAAVCAPVAAQSERPASRAAARRLQPAAACWRAHREPLPRLHAATCAPAHQPYPSLWLPPGVQVHLYALPHNRLHARLGVAEGQRCRLYKALLIMEPGMPTPAGCTHGRPCRVHLAAVHGPGRAHACGGLRRAHPALLLATPASVW